MNVSLGSEKKIAKYERFLRDLATDLILRGEKGAMINRDVFPSCRKVSLKSFRLTIAEASIPALDRHRDDAELSNKIAGFVREGEKGGERQSRRTFSRKEIFVSGNFASWTIINRKFTAFSLSVAASFAQRRMRRVLGSEQQRVSLLPLPERERGLVRDFVSPRSVFYRRRYLSVIAEKAEETPRYSLRAPSLPGTVPIPRDNDRN